ncbi:uncharacterized protein [Rutidosis leptorrhynchoides]|uniref:uncharacterized protein n=1 Tax=Rutidosis leptorrhynchoides TaxID=125765 RepID=UPI003A98DE59
MADVAEFTPLNQLNNEMPHSRVHVKVFVNWKKTYFNNPHSAMAIELILIDFKSNKIRATITKNLIPFYEHTFQEGRFFNLANFGVVECDDKVMLVNHKWKILMYRTSSVVTCPSFELQHDGYQTVPFGHITEWKINTTQVFDVVGRLVEMDPLRVKREKGVDTKSIEFLLMNASGTRIKCALWAHHATKLYDYVSGHNNTDLPIYVLIHNCKVRSWQGCPQVSNQLWGSRVYLNEDVPPIITIKAQFDLHLEGDNNSVTPVTELKVATVTNCIVRGRVQKIIAEEGWFTYTCMKCNKKVSSRHCVDTNASVYDCDTCGDVKQVYPRIRTTIRVADSSGECTLVLFDSQLSKMVKKSVAWLREKAEQSGNPYKPPTELNDILLNPFVWHVKVTDFNVHYNYFGFTVESVTDDMDVFKVIDDKLNGEQGVVNDVPTTADVQIAPNQIVTDVKTVIQSTEASAAVNPMEAEMKTWMKRTAYVQRLEDENKNMSNLIANANLIHKQDLIPANKTIIFPESTETESLKFGEVYKSWFNAHNDLISRLRAAMLSNETDTALSPIIKTVFDHLKSFFSKKVGI